MLIPSNLASWLNKRIKTQRPFPKVYYLGPQDLRQPLPYIFLQPSLLSNVIFATDQKRSAPPLFTCTFLLPTASGRLQGAFYFRIPTSEQKAVTNCPALFALLSPHPLLQCGPLSGSVLPFCLIYSYVWICAAFLWKCHQCKIEREQGVTHYNPAQVCKGIMDCSQNNPTAVIQRENLSNMSDRDERSDIFT